MPPDIGDAAPEFSAEDVTTGQTHTLEQYEGRIVLLAFNGLTWCGPCKFEAPILEDLWQEFKGGNAQFLMVSVNDPEQGFKDAVETHGITFPALTDPGSAISAAYAVTSVPTLVFIDAEGRVCAVEVGASPPADELRQHIRDVLVACGATTPPQVRDVGKWRAVATLLFGDWEGGGLALTPGGKPIPIDPWGPLRGMRRDKRNLYASLAIAELADSLKDVAEARSIKTEALRSAEGSVKRLLLGAAAVPAFTRTSEPVAKGGRTRGTTVPVTRVPMRTGAKRRS